MSRRLSITACVIALMALTTGRVTPAAQAPPPFNFDTGAAPVEIIAPAIVQVLLQITPANDAPIILRHTTLASHAWYDALAPYHPTAVGVSSNLGRRPAVERTQRNKNIAMLYASYRLMNSLQPRFAATWRGMLTSVGLNPDDTSEDLTTPVGIGNVAGRHVVADRERDGMNQLGDEGGTEFHRRPYADYTGYKPVNTPERLFDPSRWQPLVSTTGFGTFTSQQFITPQWGRTKAYSYTNPRRFNAPPPRDSRIENFAAYRAQAVDVLTRQAGLTDDQKMLAEFFDNKLNSLGFAAFFIIQTRGMSLDDLVIYDFLTNMAAFDGGIATWKEKVQFDTVRPTSAIRHLFRNGRIQAWGGPGQGTVQMKGEEWRSYLNTGNHPEYPSGSACFCAAHAQASRRYLGSDAFGLAVPVAAGSSVVEPGVTPASPTMVGPWNTFTDFENACATSRVLGGVHFQAAVDEGLALCRPIGDTAFEFLDRKVRGISQ